MYQQIVNNNKMVIVQTGLFQQDLLAPLLFQKTHAIPLSPHQIQFLYITGKVIRAILVFQILC